MVDTPLTLDLNFLEQELAKTIYDPNLGVRKLVLSKTLIGNIPINLIVLKLDPGIKLKPHFHEHGGEICLPITNGYIQFGNPQKDKSGNYLVNKEQKIITNWNDPITVTPFKALEFPECVAHYFYASESESFILMFFLPENHPSTDIKFTTNPK